MDNRTWKEAFILLILIVACIMIFSQCECFHCKCKCKCKERNRINISQPQSPVMVRATPVQIIDNNMSFNHTKLINVDASSSFIRKNIFHINEISGILDQRVLKYINSKGLYN